MLPKGLLSRALDYFFSNQNIYGRELEHSALKFLDIENGEKVKEFLKKPINETQSGIMNEWLLFDFTLENGNNLIKEYIENNFVTSYELKIYNDILGTNFYGFFEVRNVAVDEGLVLRNLRTNQDYEVKEKSATHNLQKGNLFFARLAKIDDHWEIIGANTTIIPAVKINQDLRKVYLEDKNPATPKMAFDLAETKSKDETYEALSINSVEARTNFVKELKRVGLDKFISVDVVEKWLWKIDDKFGTKIIPLLIGLSAINEIDNNFINAFSDFCNTTPKKSLGGKSPQEMINRQKDWRPEFNMSITRFGGDKWRNELEKAHSFMAERDARKSIKHFERTFLLLEKEFIVNPDIYRFYANTAVSYFNCGERFLGKAMLAIALNLNPNYDFGRRVEKDYKEGRYEETIDNGSRRRAAYQLLKSKLRAKVSVKHKIKKEIVEEILEKTEEISKGELEYIKKLEKSIEKRNIRELSKLPSVSYYQFTRDLEINFKTDKLTQSKITTYGPNGEKVNSGRNDPCVCGSGKKYKKCCGKNF